MWSGWGSGSWVVVDVKHFVFISSQYINVNGTRSWDWHELEKLSTGYLLNVHLHRTTLTSYFEKGEAWGGGGDMRVVQVYSAMMKYWREWTSHKISNAAQTHSQHGTKYCFTWAQKRRSFHLWIHTKITKSVQANLIKFELSIVIPYITSVMYKILSWLERVF